MPAVVTTSFDVTVRLAVAVQLSAAADPLNAKNCAIVVAAAGKLLAHSRSTVVGAVAVGFVLSVTVNTWSTDTLLLHASVIVYVLVITPAQLPAVVTTSFDVTVRLAVAVQLSAAADPVRARNCAIVVAAVGKLLAHSRSTVVGAVAVGFVLSVTVNT